MGLGNAKTILEPSAYTFSSFQMTCNLSTPPMSTSGPRLPSESAASGFRAGLPPAEVSDATGPAPRIPGKRSSETGLSVGASAQVLVRARARGQ